MLQWPLPLGSGQPWAEQPRRQEASGGWAPLFAFGGLALQQQLLRGGQAGPIPPVLALAHWRGGEWEGPREAAAPPAALPPAQQQRCMPAPLLAAVAHAAWGAAGQAHCWHWQQQQQQ